MTSAASFTNPIFCAVDRPDLVGVTDLCRALTGAVGGVKLGLEFFIANGAPGVHAVAACGLPIFLDLKLHDIPNTVAGAARVCAALSPAMLTLHASGGRAMLQAAREGVAGAARAPWLLGVTVLTSLAGDDLAALGVSSSALDQTLRLADLCASAGLDGVICSPQEIAALRARFGQALKLVVPGIRGPGDAAGDQKRALPAAEAMARGADILVVGRPITQAPTPRDAALALARSLPQAA